jgi:glycine dehydrogenase
MSVPFADRHIGPDDAAIAHMLAALGYQDLESFTSAVVPEVIRWHDELNVPAAQSEPAVLARLHELASHNTIATSMIGLGYTGTHTPGVIVRNILENPAWYTAYTPYQPEISQGRLEALLNFQTMIEDLTSLPVASASLLDEPTAAAEAMTLALRQSSLEKPGFLVDVDTHPQTIAVLRTRAEPLGIEIVEADLAAPLPDGQWAGVLISYPGTSGAIKKIDELIVNIHSIGAMAIVASDLLALTLLTPPGELGADVVVGSAQRFGVPMGFGGPHAGFMSVRAGLERSLPGRLVGVSIDAEGNPAYRLALQTREQHIRREKATSNICTAQVLLAVISSMYAVYHGPHGLTAIAERVNALATNFQARVSASGFEPANDVVFDTVRWSVPHSAHEIGLRLSQSGLNIRVIDDTTLSVTLDETHTLDDLDRLAALLGLVGNESGAPRGSLLDSDLRRTSPFLTHPVFNTHHNETSMLRYIRRLSDLDVALDRTMIPLGSCTMKLNGTTEMEPITWPEFSSIHPFAPLDQAEGYREMIQELEAWLVEVTGYDAVSLQPNAGSQGEFAGLLAIRGYHRSNGDEHRNICLIPSSAHGTNAASAVMAGMKVVVVSCDELGNVDVTDLQKKIADNADHIAALMITYPSTHGVFETAVADICAMVHDAGGQVYVDGANLNALVGLAKPGRFGADVSHLNLHKTFCIPHGGGGPGVGPVAVREHLAPFLPGHPLCPEAGPLGRGHVDGGVGPVSGAPWGSAGILPIPWTYISLMGPDGLKRATQVAILSANYVALRLRDSFPILYSGENGLVAHECIIDIRPITAQSGVSVDDIAKRLIDYGFHAPTMSFPVAGTLMIEPTESEDLIELERFITAMLSIRAEINEVEKGTWPVDDNPLSNAPHTASSVIGTWTHPYSAELAAFPVSDLRKTKYWPPVRRIDGAFGDRNLVCSCPRPEELAEVGN